MKEVLLGKIRGAKHLYKLMRLTKNWEQLWRHRKAPLNLRNGLIMNHGKPDSPMLLLDEVFARRWYEI